METIVLNNKTNSNPAAFLHKCGSYFRSLNNPLNNPLERAEGYVFANKGDTVAYF